MTTEIVHVEPNNSLSPEQFDKSLIDAQAKAKSLKNMISAHDWAVDIKGSEHIRVEAWITLATGYNCTAKVVPGSVKQIEGYRCAWEARAEVLRDNGDGTTTVIGGAESECGTLGDGVWEKSQPSYAVKSMAQTRAISKAISSCFRWVVVLAGYSGTPYEEMPKDNDAVLFVESNDKMPAKTSEPPATPKQQDFLKSLGYAADTTTLTKKKAFSLIKKLKLEDTKRILQGDRPEIKAMGADQLIGMLDKLGITDTTVVEDALNLDHGYAENPDIPRAVQEWIDGDAPGGRTYHDAAQIIVGFLIGKEK